MEVSELDSTVNNLVFSISLEYLILLQYLGTVLCFSVCNTVLKCLIVCFSDHLENLLSFMDHLSFVTCYIDLIQLSEIQGYHFFS